MQEPIKNVLLDTKKYVESLARCILFIIHVFEMTKKWTIIEIS